MSNEKVTCGLLSCTVVKSEKHLDSTRNVCMIYLQINLLLEGLLDLPYVGLDPSDRSALELRGLLTKLEEAEVSDLFELPVLDLMCMQS